MSTRLTLRILAIAALAALAALLCSCELTSSDLSGSVAGTVRESGMSFPLSGAVVECEGVIDVSGADGSYSLSGLPPGDRVVFATLSGYEDYSEVVGVGETTLHEIYMERYYAPARLFGYVSHSVLGPLEGATVTIGDIDVITDSLGYYEFPNLQQTSYSITVSKEGYRTLSGSVHPTSDPFQFDADLLKLEQVTLPSVADATLLMSAPGQNYGEMPDLYLYNIQSLHERFYIEFDLEDIEETAVPVSATLWLYDTIDLSMEDPREVLVAAALYPWAESTITWSNAPSTTGASFASFTFEDRWYEIDVEAYFYEWMVDDLANNGLLIDSSVDYTTSRFIFASKENEEEDKRPHVVLDYAW
jgi:hypothetical protein